MNSLTLLNHLSTLSALLIPAAMAYVLLFYALAWKRPWLPLLLIFALPPFQNDLSNGGGAKFSIAEINLLLTMPLLLMRGKRWHMGPIAIPVFLYLFVCLVSSMLSPRATTMTSMLQMVLYLVFTIVVFSSLARDERDYMPALKALVWVGILFALLSVSGVYARLNLNKNGVGGSLAGCLIVCCELWFGAKTVRQRTWMSVALGAIALGLFMTLSRGAWLGAIVGLFVLCAVRGQYSLLIRATMVMVPLLMVAWMLLPQKSKLYATSFDPSKDYNIKYRYQSVTLAQDNFEKNPVLGVGVGLRKEYDATNIVMLTLAETGVLGLAAFALIHIVLLGTIWKLKKKLKRDDPLFSFVALSGALILSCLTHGMVDHYWSRGVITTSWASVGMVTYVYYALRRRTREERRAQLAYQQSLHEGEHELRAGGNRQPQFPTFASPSHALLPNLPRSSTRLATEGAPFSSASSPFASTSPAAPLPASPQESDG